MLSATCLVWKFFNKLDNLILHTAVDTSPDMIKIADSTLLRDKDLIMKVILQDPSLLIYANESLKQDQDELALYL